jgi:hypothetical protein
MVGDVRVPNSSGLLRHSSPDAARSVSPRDEQQRGGSRSMSGHGVPNGIMPSPRTTDGVTMGPKLKDRGKLPGSLSPSSKSPGKYSSQVGSPQRIPSSGWAISGVGGTGHQASVGGEEYRTVQQSAGGVSANQPVARQPPSASDNHSSKEHEFRRLAYELLADRGVSPDDAVEGPKLEGVTTIRFQTGSRSPSYGRSVSPDPAANPWWVETSPEYGHTNQRKLQKCSQTVTKGSVGRLDTTFGEPIDQVSTDQKTNEAEILLSDLNRLIAQKKSAAKQK